MTLPSPDHAATPGLRARLSRTRLSRTSLSRTSLRPFFMVAITVLGVAWVGGALLSTGRGALDLRDDIAAAAWTMAVITPIHLLQLWLSAEAWRVLSPAVLPGLAACFRLRVIREGINSLLPVARVGGEVVAAGLLARSGVPQSAAGASIIVDVTVESLTQLLFLLGALAALAGVVGTSAWGPFASAALAATAAGGLLLAALRFGLLRLVEAMTRQIAKRWPQVGSLDGLEQAVRGIARQPGRLLRAGSLHMLTWMLGGLETWLVLHALGHPVTATQALIIESLGVAARSAGFAVPGALGVQEGGFILAAAAFGVPHSAGLSLSVIKRLREVLVGLLGLGLWRWPQLGHSRSVDPAGI